MQDGCVGAQARVEASFRVWICFYKERMDRNSCKVAQFGGCSQTKHGDAHFGFLRLLRGLVAFGVAADSLRFAAFLTTYLVCLLT